MLERERGNEQSGGWLCDEMGMGKTAVCIALTLANRQSAAAPVPRAPSSIFSFGTLTQSHVQGVPWDAPSRHKLKATLILTKVSLIAQWEDEIKKWGPSLRLRRYHGSGDRHVGSKDLSQPDIRDCDIVVGVASTKMPDGFLNKVRFQTVSSRRRRRPDAPTLSPA